MQLLHGLKDIRPESAERHAGGRGQGHLVHQYRAVAGQDGEISITGDFTGGQGDVELLPVRARKAEDLLPQDAAVPDQRDGKPPAALGIDRAHERLARNHVLRALADAGRLGPGRNLLRIIHIDRIALHEAVFTVAKGVPLRRYVGNADILRKASEQNGLSIGRSHTDVAVKGFRIVLPKGDGVLRTCVGNFGIEYLFAVPKYAHALPAATDFQMVPGFLVQLGGCRRLGDERLQRDDLPGASEHGHLLLLAGGKGELGSVHGLLRFGKSLRLVVRLDLRLGL